MRAVRPYIISKDHKDNRKRTVRNASIILLLLIFGIVFFGQVKNFMTSFLERVEPLIGVLLTQEHKSSSAPESLKTTVKKSSLTPESAEVYTKATKNEPELPPFYWSKSFKQGYDYFEKGQYHDAISVLTEVIENPSQKHEFYNDRAMKSSGYYLRGLAHFMASQYDNAISDFSKSIELDPDVDTYTARGAAYYMKSQYDNAISDYTRAIDRASKLINPRASICYKNRAIAYQMKGLYSEAERDFNKARELERKEREGYVSKEDVL